MKITRGPAKYEPDSVEFECHNCSTKFIADPGEYEETGFWRQYFTDDFTQCKCPVCGKTAYSMYDGIRIAYDDKRDKEVESDDR